MAKMGRNMVAVCATAIGIIYSAGYVVTGPSVAALAQNSPASVASTQNKSNVQAKKTPTPNTQKAANTPVNSASSATSSQGKYRNGTYNGQGSNRIGAVEVAVTVNKGKIISCEITNCSTHYSVSAIDPALPQEVVARQSGNVDVVSGATRSTEDFQTAVQQALNQAQS
jgi:uncharacterized protein with FMN-binding domain